MRLRIIFWSILTSTIFGLLFWRNNRKYKSETISWKLIKCFSEIVLLLLVALRLPFVLVAWCCVWITKPIQTTWVKATVGAISGMLLGLAALYMLEVLLILGVFSIDEITGDREGFLANLYKARKDNSNE
jgi:hypothetical protein